MRESATENRKQFKTRHVGHPQIGNDDIREDLSHYLEGSESVLRRPDRKSEAADDRSGGLQHEGFVIDDKDTTFETAV
jgi:hypothetical protein